MFSGRELIEAGIERWKVYDEIKWFNPVESGESLADFLFGIFSGRIEWSDVAVAEAGPLRKAGCGFERAYIPMEINETIMLAERMDPALRFVISGQDPNAFSQRLQDFAAAIEAFAKVGQISGGDIHIRLLIRDFLQRAQISVNVAEDQNVHGVSPLR